MLYRETMATPFLDAFLLQQIYSFLIFRKLKLNPLWTRPPLKTYYLTYIHCLVTFPTDRFSWQSHEICFFFRLSVVLCPLPLLPTLSETTSTSFASCSFSSPTPPPRAILVSLTHLRLSVSFAYRITWPYYLVFFHPSATHIDPSPNNLPWYPIMPHLTHQDSTMPDWFIFNYS